MTFVIVTLIVTLSFRIYYKRTNTRQWSISLGCIAIGSVILQWIVAVLSPSPLPNLLLEPMSNWYITGDIWFFHWMLLGIIILLFVGETRPEMIQKESFFLPNIEQISNIGRKKIIVFTFSFILYIVALWLGLLWDLDSRLLMLILISFPACLLWVYFEHVQVS